MIAGGDLGCKLTFDDVQLAMSRHRYTGLQDGKLDALHYTENRRRVYDNHSTTQLFTMEARSISDHLLLRTQTVLKLDLS
jgi:hypothetical protein